MSPDQLALNLDARDGREQLRVELRQQLEEQTHRKDVLVIFDELTRDDTAKASYDLVRAVKSRLGSDVSESNVLARVRQIRDVLGPSVVPRAKRHSKNGPFRYRVVLKGECP